MRKLTQKQKAYARERARGKELADAYTSAGYSASQTKDAQKKNAWILENTSASADAIRARIEDLQRRADAGAVLDRKARLGLLADFALDDSKEDANRLRAVDMLNRMHGDYTDRLQTENTISLSYADRLDAIADSIE